MGRKDILILLFFSINGRSIFFIFGNGSGRLGTVTVKPGQMVAPKNIDHEEYEQYDDKSI